MNLLPRPGSLCTAMRPPWARTTLWQIDSPSPEPSPAARVVKKGSKSRSRCSGAIPRPVSQISTRTSSPCSDVRTPISF